MVAYLANGWFTQVGPRRLRAEVVDGAIDAAASLHQARVPAQALDELLLRLRTLTFLLTRSPLFRPGLPSRPTFGQAERHALRHHLTEATDAHVSLQAFVLDCLDHVGDLGGVQAFYLHMMHVAHLAKLLRLAQAHTANHVVSAAAQTETMALPAQQAQATWHVPR